MGPYNQPRAPVALLRYAGMGGVSDSVADTIRARKAGQNSVMSVGRQTGTDLYRAHGSDAQYHWGHNAVRANVGNLNLDFANFGIHSDNAAQYRTRAHQHLHWLRGANPWAW